MSSFSSHYIKRTRELHRVVITGIGAVTPLGNSLTESWNKLIAGASGVDFITRFDSGPHTTKIAGEVKNFQPENFIDQKELKKMDLFIQYALSSAAMATEQAGLSGLSNYNERAGVIVGTSMGGMPGVERQHKKLLSRGPLKVSPFFIPSVLANMAAARVAMRFGIHGPQFTIKSACATGTHSIGEAFRYIQDGICDVMLTGGTEGNISPLCFAGFEALGGLSSESQNPQKASRPWDLRRNGFVVSEGACIFVLESLDHAINRGARILAEVTGYAATSDAYHMTSPRENGEGLINAVRLALAQSETSPDDVDHINAHAASTKIGDAREAISLASIFGEAQPTISSNKGSIGHCLGAAGAIESAFSVMSILENRIPPQLNLENPEGIVKGFALKRAVGAKKISKVLKTSVGFGGANAALLFSEFIL